MTTSAHLPFFPAGLNRWQLRALPAHLHCVIPPRLHALQSVEVQPEEVFHALGQPLAAAQFQRSAD